MAERSEPDAAVSHPVALTARRDAGAALHLVTLTPPSYLTAAYRAPGQYIEVRAETPGYFVLAGDVGASSWELLVRNSGGAADALVNAPLGATFDVAGPLGTGFPVERATGRSLVLAVVGSALAVARPILKQRLRSGAPTHVYIGARSASDLPLAEEIAGWAAAGARVVLCLSRVDEPPSLLTSPSASGVITRSGWVQRVIEDDIRSGPLSEGHALIFAAGPADMLDEVRALVQRAPGDTTAVLEVVTNV